MAVTRWGPTTDQPLHTRITIPDADIKLLPTTPITAIPAVAGALVNPHKITSVSNTLAGAYTNLNAAVFSYFGIDSGAGIVNLFGYLPDDAGFKRLDNTGAPVAAPLTRFTTALGTANRAMIHWPLIYEPDDINDTQWNAIANMWTDYNALINKPLTLYVDNGGSGVFTGGNAANTWKFDIWYSLWKP